MGIGVWGYPKECVICGSPYVHIHHIIHGRGRRKISDKYGYVIPLCVYHHNQIHTDRAMDLEWIRRAQEHYEENNGSREDFIREFWKSYL